jgi:SPP1 gp7 family putative phage head morphogenesis protein
MATKPPPKPEFKATKILERAYAKGIQAITGRVLVAKRKDQTFSEWLAQLNDRANQKDVQDASRLLAERMIFAVSTRNMKTWRAAAAKSSQSRQLYQLLQKEMEGPTGAKVHQLVRENASYISSISLDAAQTVVSEVEKAQQAGARTGTLSKMYAKRFPELIRSRVNLISRTETAKASTALTQARCDNLNIQWFEWITSEDSRVRLSHRNMNGVIVAWNDLPSPEALAGEKSYGKYAAGGIFNCRCTLAPILAFSDVSWPHRVYHAGSVKQMTLPDFKKIAAPSHGEN